MTGGSAEVDGDIRTVCANAYSNGQLPMPKTGPELQLLGVFTTVDCKLHFLCL